MIHPPRVARGWRTLSFLTLVALALTLGGLVVQHLRRAWPFSPHQGTEAPRHTPTAGASYRGAPAASLAVRGRAAVAIPRAQLDAIGVRVARVTREEVGRPVRAVATVALDESRVSHVHTRVSGWIERLYVNTTGQRVTRGAPLAALFSPAKGESYRGGGQNRRYAR